MTTESLNLRPTSPIARTTLLLTGLFVVTATAAMAVSVTVDCDGGAADFPTIQAAVDSLPLADLNIITVAGTCVESVFVNNFADLRVEAVAAGATVQGTASSVFDIVGSESVRLSGLTMDATAGNSGVLVVDSNVWIVRSDISRAGDTGIATIVGGEVNLGGPAVGDAVVVHDNVLGIFASESKLNLLGRVTIENNTEGAIIFNQAEGSSSGRDVGNTIRNNGAGISVVHGGLLSFRGLNTIENNGAYGLLAVAPERVVFSASSSGPPFYGTTIRDHSVWGIVATATQLDFHGVDQYLVHAVENNGAPPYAMDAGIWLGRHAEARLRNMTIDNNFGPGVHGTLGSYVNLFNTSISNNSRHGVLLSWNTTGDLGSFSLDGTTIGPNVTITGNRGRAIQCTEDSVLAGDRAGISPIRCGRGGRRSASETDRSEVEDSEETFAGLPDYLELEQRILDRSSALEAYAERLLAARRAAAEGTPTSPPY